MMEPSTELFSQNRQRTRSRHQTPNLIEEVFRLYDRALAAASTGIVIADAIQPTRPIVYCNPAFEKITGYDRSEIIGRNCNFLQGPDTEEAAIAEIRAALNQERDCHVILKNYRKDGTPFWNELMISPVRDVAGHLTHFIGVQTDITERKQSEDALRSQDYWLQTSLDAVPDAIALRDGEGRWLVANNYAIQLLKLYGVDYRGKTDAELSELAGESMKSLLLSCAETDESTWKVGTMTQYNRSIPLPTGGTNLFEVRKVPLFNPDGSRKGLVVVGRDITQQVQTEEALIESEQRFRTIFERAAIGMALANLSGRLIATNPSLQAMLGYSEVELGAMAASELTYAEDVAIELELTEQLIWGDRESYQIEKRYLCKNGRVRWGRSSVSLIRTSQGEPQFLLEMVEDITDRKQAQLALAHNEAKWRSLIQNSSDIITILKCDATIRYQSPSVQRILGYSPEELIGKSFFDFLHPEDVSRAIADLPFLGEPQKPVAPIELRFRHAKGSWCFLEAAGANLLADPAVGGIVINSRDITARKQSDYRLEQINECFLQFGPDAVENIHRLTTLAGELLGGTCALYNRLEEGWLRSLGQWQVPPNFPPLDRPEGHICYDVIQQASPEPVVFCNLQNSSYAQSDRHVTSYQLQTYLGQAVRQGESYVGSLCVVYVNQILPTEADRKLIGIIAAAIGVEEERAAAAASERQKSQELEKALYELKQAQMQLIQTEKMSSLGQMLAGVAHEINNPVNFVAGNIDPINSYIEDLLELVQLYNKEYLPTPPVQEETGKIDLEFLMSDLPKLLASMKKGCDRIVEIVRSLRNFSRVDEAKMKRADLQEGLETTLLILNNRLKAKAGKVPIKVIKNYGDLPLVLCYPGQMNQVFMNILVNAIDALEEEVEKQGKGSHPFHPSIEITTQAIGTEFVSISIKDNGPGIPEETIAKLFDPFFTTKPLGKGTGLGLSISYQIVVEKHGGKLRCCSEIGQGTEFIIEIPIEIRS